VDLRHLDEHGHPCTHHAAAAPADLLALAIVGSRAPSFHHDLASKLQGLMMAIDEIGELAAGADSALQNAIETAHGSLRDVLALLNLNRAMTKAPAKSAVDLGELVTRAAERVYVKLGGALPPAKLQLSVPSVMHALSLVFDVAGGPGRGRALQATTVIDAASVVLTVSASAEAPPNAAESLALATFVLEREGGSLRCAGDGTRFVVRLPLHAV